MDLFDASTLLGSFGIIRWIYPIILRYLPMDVSIGTVGALLRAFLSRIYGCLQVYQVLAPLCFWRRCFSSSLEPLLLMPSSSLPILLRSLGSIQTCIRHPDLLIVLSLTMLHSNECFTQMNASLAPLSVFLLFALVPSSSSR